MIDSQYDAIDTERYNSIIQPSAQADRPGAAIITKENKRIDQTDLPA